jgi:AcrR family transcriptional regulator
MSFIMDEMYFDTGSEIKDRILNNSIELFRTRGIKNVSTEMIASECGISKKTLYETFESKEQMVNEIIKYSETMLDLHWEKIHSKITHNPDVDFIELFHQLMLIINKIFYVMSTPFLSDLKKLYPHIWNELREYRRQRIKNYFGVLFEIGQKAGFIRADISPDLAYFIHYFTIDNILTPEIISEIPLSANDIIEGVLKILMTGLLTEKGVQTHETFCKQNPNK